MKFKELFNEDWTFKWEVIEKIPQFDKLKSTQQSTVWHKEGNAYFHTVLVVQEMKFILDDNHLIEGSDEWIMCMVAALCHDLGKAETTKWSDEKQDWTTKNHGVVGERITRNLFYDEDITQREKVCYMVRHHMTLHHIFDKPEETNKRLIKLSHGIVPIRFVLYLNHADSKGSLNEETVEYLEEKYNRILGRTGVMDCYDKPYTYIEKSQLIRDFIDYKGEIINKSNDFCVYILCGFPGCGKSTYIEWFLADKPIVSRDVIRGELGIGGATVDNNKKVVGTREEEEKVSEIFDNRMISYCEDKESFVIDNTNLKYQYRKDYLLKIMKYNPKVKIIYIEAPNFIEDCIERRNGEIPTSVYERMNSTFDFPQLYECDELLIYKEHTDIEDEFITFSSNDSPQMLPFEERILNDLKVTRGAMILDGYDCCESCIKYMDRLIAEYSKLKYIQDKLNKNYAEKFRQREIDEEIQNVINKNFWEML